MLALRDYFINLLIYDRYLAMSSNDRVVRVYEVSHYPLEMEALHKLQDKVGRTQWNGISWSGNGEYVIGGMSLRSASIDRALLIRIAL